MKIVKVDDMIYNFFLYWTEQKNDHIYNKSLVQGEDEK